MPLPSPNEATDKWARNFGGARQSYIDGVNRVNENPMEKAAAAFSKWRAALEEVFRNGKWQLGLLSAGTLAQWKATTINQGAERLQSGAAKGKTKVMRFMQYWLPRLEQNLAEVRAMPSDTYDQRKARMNRMADLNHDAARTAAQSGTSIQIPPL